MVLSLWDRIYCSSVLLCLHPNLFHAIKANEHTKKKKKMCFLLRLPLLLRKLSFFLVWPKDASLRTPNRWEVVSIHLGKKVYAFEDSVKLSSHWKRDLEIPEVEFNLACC